jgi:uncharacterized membrane-anchored protein
MVLFALPIIAGARLGLNEILTFWFAGVMARPMGVSWANWLDKPLSIGSLGWGDGSMAPANGASHGVLSRAIPGP